jgi:shikimate kinase
MIRSRNVFLIGGMGSGKTTVGKYLAQQLHHRFYDADEEVELRSGVEISWIFDVEGEPGFREREKQIIEELTRLSPIVLATGGGAILMPENRQCLASRGVVVYLETTVDSLVERTLKDKKRPLLRDVNTRREKLTRLLDERIDLYRGLADYTFSTDARTARSVSEEILAVLGHPVK